MWCGQSEGSICIFGLGEGVVTGQEVVNHYDPILPGLEVLQMVATDNLILDVGSADAAVDSADAAVDYDGDGLAGGSTAVEAGPVVWSYVYPGCVVYRWDPTARRIVYRLDCSKLAPCSESLQSISIEEHLSPGRCQVSILFLKIIFSSFMSIDRKSVV